MPDEILPLPEVAQLLKVAVRTVYTMSQKSQLSAFKVAGTGGLSASILIAGSSSRRQTPRTSESAEMGVPSRGNPSSPQDALSRPCVTYCIGDPAI
jgi:hypothetical protein